MEAGEPPAHDHAIGAIFVSHSNQDRSLVDWLTRVLEQAGFTSLFVDYHRHHGLGGGDAWRTELLTALRRCDVVLFLGTKDSNTSPWCAAELALALQRSTKILPVVVAGTPRHKLLEEIQEISIVGESPAGAELIVAELARMRVGKDGEHAMGSQRVALPGSPVFR